MLTFLVASDETLFKCRQIRPIYVRNFMNWLLSGELQSPRFANDHNFDFSWIFQVLFDFESDIAR